MDPRIRQMGPALNEQRQITFMQVRISRMAAVRWGCTLRRVMDLFCAYGVLEYIESCFDYLHLEGDEAVFSDVQDYLRAKGAFAHA